MQHARKKFSVFLLLSVGLMDYLGLGLVFPMFTFLLFDPTSGILAPDASDAVRGLWLGILFGLAPAVLFFSSPILGAMSDAKGRKTVLQLSILVGFLSYLVGVFAVLHGSLVLLIVSRILYGVLAGSVTIVQAGLVDLSVGNEKQKFFAYYNMVLGAGYCLGPFLGGILSKPTFHGWLNYSTPFVVAAFLTLLNWVLIMIWLPETFSNALQKKMPPLKGLFHFKQMAQLKGVRLVFLVMFLFFFGWSFFSEFISVLLMKRFEYNQAAIGGFYAYIGVVYAVCAGLLIQPILNYFAPRRILELTLLVGGCYFYLFAFICQSWVMWLYLLPLVFAIAMVYPTATAVVSNATPHERQGEVLGLYGSVQSLALMLSPFAAGSLVAVYPVIAILMAASAMLLSGIILFFDRIKRVS